MLRASCLIPVVCFATLAVYCLLMFPGILVRYLKGGSNPLEWLGKLNPFDKERRDAGDGTQGERE